MLGAVGAAAPPRPAQGANKNFPQFVVIHTVKGFSIVNEAEVDVFLDSLALSMIQQMLAIWSLVPLPFLNPA